MDLNTTLIITTIITSIISTGCALLALKLEQYKKGLRRAAFISLFLFIIGILYLWRSAANDRDLLQQMLNTKDQYAKDMRLHDKELADVKLGKVRDSMTLTNLLIKNEAKSQKQIDSVIKDNAKLKVSQSLAKRNIENLKKVQQIDKAKYISDYEKKLALSTIKERQLIDDTIRISNAAAKEIASLKKELGELKRTKIEVNLEVALLAAARKTKNQKNYSITDKASKIKQVLVKYQTTMPFVPVGSSYVLITNGDFSRKAIIQSSNLDDEIIVNINSNELKSGKLYVDLFSGQSKLNRQTFFLR